VPSCDQLDTLAAALRAAESPADFLPLQAAVGLLLQLSAQRVLPPAWRDLDGARLSSALAAFDPVLSGYLEWRELVLALAAVALPAVHTATPAQVASQALKMADADSDSDGCLTRQEFEGLRWWFEPREELVQEAAADGQQQEEQHAQALRELRRCGVLGEAGSGSECCPSPLATPHR
jgi:hypothetical protein